MCNIRVEIKSDSRHSLFDRYLIDHLSVTTVIDIVPTSNKVNVEGKFDAWSDHLVAVLEVQRFSQEFRSRGSAS